MNSFLRSITAQTGMLCAYTTAPRITTTAFFLSFLLLSSSAFAQTYTSKNNYTGNWSTNTTWTGGTAPGTSIVGTANVYGKVSLTGALSTSTSGSGGVLNIYDTLSITGAFTNNGTFSLKAGGVFNAASFNNTSSGGSTADIAGTLNVSGGFTNANDLTIQSGATVTIGGDYNNTSAGAGTLGVYGTMIVKGNLLTANDITVYPGGLLIVLGDLSVTNSGGATIINQGNTVAVGDISINNAITTGGQFYLFDDTPTFSWSAVIDGVQWNNTNTAALTAAFPTENAIPAWLWSILQGLGVSGGPLPVTLIGFSYSLTNNGIALKWSTATELNFDYFNVQRSLDGRKFETIAQVKGNGTTTTRHDYSYFDSNPIAGTSYYRLQSVDFDKYTETFNVIAVSLEATPDVVLFPIPVVDSHLYLQLNFAPKEEIAVTIYSATGIEKTRAFIKASETNAQLNVSLDPGVYIVKMSSIDFNKVSHIVVK
ncbi:MAG: hypothetical protein DI538_15550 [Azospira oryzae]|nr:MAG: hypothetical protein DI538_15550 [Azospira oryzae]